VPWGGSEELWSKVALNLKEKVDVSVLYKKWKQEPEQIKQLKKEGVTVIYKNSNTTKKGNSLISKFKKIINTSQSSKRHLETLNQIQYFNLVVISLGNHVDTNILPYTNYLIRQQIPYIIIVQLATDLRYLSDVVIDQLIVAYKQAKIVFFVSKENAQKTELQFGTLLDNKALINNPFFYEQKYTPVEIKEFNLACVAALNCFHKGQDLLVHVLNQEKWKKRNLVLNLYGNGVNKNQLERLIKLYNLEEKVKIRGFKENKAEIWKENIACVMPSRMEGQSLAMLEAMSHGRMIISTNVGDAKRLIINNKTGFIIDSPAIEFIDEALENAWNKRTNWEEMGLLSREHLYKTITIDPVVELSEKLIYLMK
jgi:glycosyltransferase involved in cell wall biosynthesis